MSTDITALELKAIRVSIETALKGVAEKHNLSKLSIGRISYTASSFSAKLTAEREVTKVVVPGESPSTGRGESALEISCWLIGLDKSYIPKTYVVNGHHCKIVEIKPKNRAYPVIVAVQNGDKVGSRYKLSTFQLKTLEVVNV